ncbi:MAG TPA: hypothetical protein VF406_19080 [Thermodesulfobacteriota bacterium]
MRQRGEAVHLLGDLITFTIKRADVRTANLAIDRLGDRLEAIARDDLPRASGSAEVFADEVAYHAAHLARACLEVRDEENLEAVVRMVERIAVALLETGHGSAAAPLVSHLVSLGRELVRRAEGGSLLAVAAALERAGRTLGDDPAAQLLDPVASGLGVLGVLAADQRFEADSLDPTGGTAADPVRAVLEALERLARLAVARGLEAGAAAALAAVSAVGRAIAGSAASGSAGQAAAVLRGVAETAALAGRAAPVAAALPALADLAEAGRRLDRPDVVEAALRALAALGETLETHAVTLGDGTDGAAACARRLREAGDGYEYLVARALRAAGEGTFRRRFQGGTAPAGPHGR